MPFSRENRHTTLSLIAVIVGLFVVAIGAQLYVAAQDDSARDREDRAYAECLTDWAANLTSSAVESREASIALDKARDRKDRLLDKLLVVIATAQDYRDDTPHRSDLPPALLARYQALLEARVEAQKRFAQLDREYDRTVAQNPYESPKVVCER